MLGCKVHIVVEDFNMFQAVHQERKDISNTLYKSEVGKLVHQKSHLQKTKNTSKPQNQSVVSIQVQ